MPDLKQDDRGLYEKFRVERTDGNSGPGRKHDNCRYFVLDLDHDEFALEALITYAAACRQKRPRLAADLDQVVVTIIARAAVRLPAPAGK